MDPFTLQANDITDATFKNVEHRAETLANKTFTDCTFQHCSLVECTLMDCTFIDCTFSDCDLSLLQVPGTAFTRARFEDCKMVGVNWTDARWEALSSFSFLRSNLSHGTFAGMQMGRRISLYQCTAHNIDFADANLARADLRETDFTDSRFQNTDLTEADFSRATNYHIPLLENTAKKARFTLPEAINLLRGLDIVLVDDEEDD
jgi:hypothetical protein